MLLGVCCKRLNDLLQDQRCWRQPWLLVRKEVWPSVLFRALHTKYALVEVDFSGCITLSNEILAKIWCQYSTLRYLNITGCLLLDDTTLRLLAESRVRLHTLRASRCPRMTWRGWMVAARLATTNGMNLRVLQLGDGPVARLKDQEHVEQIVQAWPYLRELTIGWGDDPAPHGSADGALTRMAPFLRTLKKLELRRWAVALEGMKSICTHCSELTHLSLARSSSHNLDIIYLATRLRTLQGLDLSRCTQVVNVTLECIGSHMHDLRSLNVSGCRRVSNTGLQAIIRGLSQLRDLLLRDCHLIDSVGIHNATLYCPHLLYLDVSGTMVCRFALGDLRVSGNPALRIRAESCPCVIDPTLASLQRRLPEHASLVYYRQRQNGVNAIPLPAPESPPRTSREPLSTNQVSHPVNELSPHRWRQNSFRDQHMTLWPAPPQEEFQGAVQPLRIQVRREIGPQPENIRSLLLNQSPSSNINRYIEASPVPVQSTSMAQDTSQPIGGARPKRRQRFGSQFARNPSPSVADTPYSGQNNNSSEDENETITTSVQGNPEDLPAEVSAMSQLSIASSWEELSFIDQEDTVVESLGAAAAAATQSPPSLVNQTSNSRAAGTSTEDSPPEYLITTGEGSQVEDRHHNAEGS